MSHTIGPYRYLLYLYKYICLGRLKYYVVQETTSPTWQRLTNVLQYNRHRRLGRCRTPAAANQRRLKWAVSIKPLSSRFPLNLWSAMVAAARRLRPRPTQPYRHHRTIWTRPLCNCDNGQRWNRRRCWTLIIWACCNCRRPQQPPRPPSVNRSHRGRCGRTWTTRLHFPERRRHHRYVITNTAGHYCATSVTGRHRHRFSDATPLPTTTQTRVTTEIVTCRRTLATPMVARMVVAATTTTLTKVEETTVKTSKTTMTTRTMSTTTRGSVSVLYCSYYLLFIIKPLSMYNTYYIVG